MGWGFRKSLNLGLLRINSSKSGLGYSIGGKGFRVGRDARGRSYRSLSIPGVGISNRTYTGTTRQNVKTGYTGSPKPIQPKRASGRISPQVVGKGVLYVLAAFLLYAIASWVRHSF